MRQPGLRKVAEQLVQEARVQLPPQLRDGFAALAGEIDAVLASIVSDPHFTRAQKRVLRDALAGRPSGKRRSGGTSLM